MVKVQEYKPDQFMINVTKEEALQLIKSIATQLYNDNCNRDRVEFSKRRKDDVEYFSIAVDESESKFHVMTNMINDYSMRDTILQRCETLKEAQDYIEKFEDKGLMEDSFLWIKEVQS